MREDVVEMILLVQVATLFSVTGFVFAADSDECWPEVFGP